MNPRVLLVTPFAVLTVVLAFSGAGCDQTTGSGLATFTARAGGPADVTPGAPLEFDTGSGFHVSLTRAHFHLGAVYLNMTQPLSGAAEESCVQPGIYVAEAFGACDATTAVCGVDLDLLSPSLIPFPSPGQGTVNKAVEAEVWLTGGDINAQTDTTAILDVAGTATRNTDSWPFSGIVTIGANRALAIQNPALPGANPICHQRIVPQISVDFTVTDGGILDLRVDPRGMFNGLDFSGLTVATGTPPIFIIPDEAGGPGGALYKGVVANSGVYDFSWADESGN